MKILIEVFSHHSLTVLPLDNFDPHLIKLMQEFCFILDFVQIRSLNSMRRHISLLVFDSLTGELYHRVVDRVFAHHLNDLVVLFI